MDSIELNNLKRKELLDVARSHKIKQASRYRKSDLIELIVKQQQSRFSYREDKPKAASVLHREGSLTEIQPELTEDTALNTEKAKELPETVTLNQEETFQPEPPEQFSLPYSYNVTKIVLMIRDPYWAYVYWDIDEAKYKEICYLFQRHSGRIKTILRVYDVTDVNFNGFNAHRVFDLDVNLDTKSWYIDLGVANRDYLVDVGLLGDDGKFYLIARSNIMRSPRDSVSDIVDENWMTTDFDELYSLSGGLETGLSSGEARRRKKLLFEQLVSSGSITGGVASSPGLFQKDVPKAKDFFLEVGTELILYGRTHSDAKVKVAGKNIPLRPDGTFSLRFSLADGELDLPVEATSADSEDTRKIRPTVRKNTQ